MNQAIPYAVALVYFFLFIHYSHTTYQIMVLYAVRAVAVRCKLPFALRPVLSQDVMRTKGITKERKASVKAKGKSKGKAPPSS